MIAHPIGEHVAPQYFCQGSPVQLGTEMSEGMILWARMMLIFEAASEIRASWPLWEAVGVVEEVGVVLSPEERPANRNLEWEL